MRIVRHIQHTTLLLLALFLVVGCHKNDPKPPLPPKVNRTILVYLAGNNNLYTYLSANMKTMSDAMKKGKLGGNLVVYFTRPDSLPALYRIDYKGNRIKLKQYPAHNSVSKEVFAQVIADTKAFYPADSYGLVLSSHGLGWLPSTEKLPNARSIPLEYTIWEKEPNGQLTKWFGQDGRNFMDIPDLAAGLPKDRSFDFILFDACFMSSIETMYDLRYAAKYIIASPAEILAAGFPYDIVTPLFMAETLDLKAICKGFMEYYRKVSSTKSGTIALINTSQLEPLAQTVAAIFDQYPDPTVDVSRIQPYESLSTHVFYDLGDYLSQVATASPDLYGRFTTQLNQTIEFADHTETVYSNYGGAFPVNSYQFSGISTYIPQPQFPLYNAAYRETEWAQTVGN